ncbi:methionine synthase [Kosmotoga pacifica]|uniref:Methionine synthase n=1 Tax=Kosmotoga pacifica TaxID=1330330 RepID=A0A0G2Z7L0_9BACT|nr:methionine synthase [Kosmotoga pacifica]AKI97532.1 methionine synthase [Kosmotoga pacifica]
MKSRRKKILGGAIGSDVHVAGILNFLDLARKENYKTIYLGGAIPLEKLIGGIIETDPEIVAISYRLGKEALKNLLKELENTLKREGLLNNRSFVFGGTHETANIAREFGLFEKIFDGSESVEDVVMYLRGEMRGVRKEDYPQQLVERIEFKAPYPLIRHHIGLQTLEETESEIIMLAESEQLDIISLAPDQNAQQWFFNSEKMDPSQDGAGGAPFRKEEDFARMYRASRRGNFPLLRCYSGTQDLIKFSKLLHKTINNAWAAIPLTWYSELDRRSDRDLKDAIKENQKAIEWNASHGIPVEINESHQWALRYAHDTVEVATAFLAAYNAKKLGVKTYVAQYMFNTPPGISPAMDIAKMLAKKELIESLHDESFHSYRMVRTGLLSFPADEDMAKGQLISSTFTASYLQPHIIHVVAFCEAKRRAKAKEIIESVKMVKKAYTEAMKGLPDFEADQKIKTRKEELVQEALLIIEAIKQFGKGSKDPLVDPEVIWAAIKTGILDAPGLMKMSVARGSVKTGIVNGANRALDDEGQPITEKKRLERLGFRL